MNGIRSVAAFALSPTYWYADFRKTAVRDRGKEAVGALIRKYNKRYFATSMIMLFGLGTTYEWNVYPDNSYRCIYVFLVAVVIWIFPLSRANEIFYAFYRDAISKLNGEEASSDLKYGERVRLALTSYGELVSDFAAIYLLIPKSWIDQPIESVWDALYFSGVTITTLGYGDLTPEHPVPQLLVVYEVFCGFILLIVSFAIYAGRGLGASDA